MSVVASELEMVIRARNEATRTITQVQSGLRQLRNEAQSTSSALKGIGGGVNISAAPIQALSGALGQARSQAQSLGSSLRQGLIIGTGIAAATAAINALRSAFESTVGAVAKFSTGMETAGIAIETLVGDATKARNLTASLLKFSADTPFEFPGIQKAGQALLNVGVQAESIIPVIKGTGIAAALSGQEITQSFDRVNTTLTQVIAKGQVYQEELQQFAEAGVPALQILSKHFGTTDQAMKQLVADGKVGAADLVVAFTELSQSDWADVLVRQSRTLAGALTTIKDNVLQFATVAGTDLFNALRDAANAVADFTRSDTFSTWATVAREALNAVGQGVQRATAFLAPLGRAFQEAFAHLNTGNFQGALTSLQSGFSQTLGNLLAQVQSFARGFFGAGADLVGEFAGGMLSAAGSVLRGVADTIAGIIGAFFIGHSPPPEGPLNQITQGGATLMQEYGKGMSGAIDAAITPVARDVAGALGGINDALNLEGARSGAQAAAGDLKALEASAKGVEATIRQIEGAMRDLEKESSNIRFAMEDIKAAADSQADPLERQVDVLTKRRDYLQEERSLTLDLQVNAARYAEELARGDPIIRARLDAELRELDVQHELISLTQRRADIENELSRGMQSAAQAHLDSLRSAEREASFDDREKTKAEQQLDALNSKQESLRFAERKRAIDERARKGENVRGERQALQLDLQRSNLQKQIAKEREQQDRERRARQREIFEAEKAVEAEKKAQADKERESRRALLEIERQQIDKRIQLIGLTDQSALSQASKQRAVLEAEQAAVKHVADQESIKKRILALPLEAQIERIRDAEKEALEPLEKQEAALKRQRDLLTLVRGDWQAMKADIDAAVKQQKDAEKDAKGAGIGGDINARLPKEELANAEELKAKFEARGRELAQQIGAGFTGWWNDNREKVIAGTLGGVAAAALFGPLGFPIGAAIGGGIADGLKETFGPGVFTEINKNLNFAIIAFKQGLAGIEPRVFDDDAQIVKLAAQAGKSLRSLMGGDIEGAIDPLAESLGKALNDAASRVDWDKVGHATGELLWAAIRLGIEAFKGLGAIVTAIFGKLTGAVQDDKTGADAFVDAVFASIFDRERWTKALEGHWGEAILAVGLLTAFKFRAAILAGILGLAGRGLRAGRGGAAAAAAAPAAAGGLAGAIETGTNVLGTAVTIGGILTRGRAGAVLTGAGLIAAPIASAIGLPKLLEALTGGGSQGSGSAPENVDEGGGDLASALVDGITTSLAEQAPRIQESIIAMFPVGAGAGALGSHLDTFVSSIVGKLATIPEALAGAGVPEAVLESLMGLFPVGAGGGDAIGAHLDAFLAGIGAKIAEIPNYVSSPENITAVEQAVATLFPSGEAGGSIGTIVDGFLAGIGAKMTEVGNYVASEANVNAVKAAVATLFPSGAGAGDWLGAIMDAFLKGIEAKMLTIGQYVASEGVQAAVRQAIAQVFSDSNLRTAMAGVVENFKIYGWNAGIGWARGFIDAIAASQKSIQQSIVNVSGSARTASTTAAATSTTRASTATTSTRDTSGYTTNTLGASNRTSDGALLPGSQDITSYLQSKGYRPGTADFQDLYNYLAGLARDGNIEALPYDMPITGRLHGGPGERGRAYRPAENELEVFVPNTNGTFKALGSGGVGLGGGNISLTVNLNGIEGDGDVVQRAAYEGAKQALQAALRGFTLTETIVSSPLPGRT